MNEAILYVALYSAKDGKLLGIGSEDCGVIDTHGIAEIKVSAMLWDKNMKPLTGSVTYTVNKID